MFPSNKTTKYLYIDKHGFNSDSGFINTTHIKTCTKRNLV
jgi:hypothetical protein